MAFNFTGKGLSIQHHFYWSPFEYSCHITLPFIFKFFVMLVPFLLQSISM